MNLKRYNNFLKFLKCSILKTSLRWLINLKFAHFQNSNLLDGKIHMLENDLIQSQGRVSELERETSELSKFKLRLETELSEAEGALAESSKLHTQVQLPTSRLFKMYRSCYYVHVQSVILDTVLI